MKKKLLTIALMLAVVLAMTACGGSGDTEDAGETAEKTTVNVFAAASLGNVMGDFEKSYEEANPDVDIVINAEGTRTNVVNNQLVVITQPDSGTAVTGLADIANAKSIALADGSVPVGKYTRQAMINLGLLAEAEDPAAITTEEVSEQLGGVEISEQGNVSKVLTAVEEGSSEVGTTYLSDTVGHEDSIRILETVGYDVTGNIIYPVAQVVNQDASEAESAAAADFIAYITNDDAKALYQQYGFDTDVE